MQLFLLIWARCSRPQPRWAAHDPTDPVGWLLFNVLEMVAELESELIPLRTRAGVAVARARGHLRSWRPNLTAKEEARLAELLRLRPAPARTR